jgi:membrane fusion protein (multidrug efflux system)
MTRSQIPVNQYQRQDNGLPSADSDSRAQGTQAVKQAPTGNFTKVVQRIPVKVVFEPQSIRGYESRITPGMSAVVSVEGK